MLRGYTILRTQGLILCVSPVRDESLNGVSSLTGFVKELILMDPDEIIEPFFSRKRLPKFKSGYLYWVITGFLGLIFLRTSFYSVGPDEAGVVQRFGKYIATTQPGLHFKLPFAIDTVRKVKVKRKFKQEFGFRTLKAGIRTQYSTADYSKESLMLTGDLNVLDVEWIVQYTIKDPKKYLFNIHNPVKTVRDLSESVMRRIVGDFLFDEVLTVKRNEVNILVKQSLQKVLDYYGTGIQIVTVALQGVNAPDPVKPAFNEVNEAEQEKEQLINQAWQVYNEKIPKAKGDALKIISQAQGYALEKVNNAEGESERFLSLLASYKKAPEITRKRLYLEAMAKIIKRAGRKYLIDTKTKGIIPLLNLDRK